MVGTKFSSGISAYFHNDKVVVETIISKTNTQYKEKGSTSNSPPLFASVGRCVAA